MLKNLISYSIVLLMTIIFALMLRNGVEVTGVATWNEGCKEAAQVLGAQWGVRYKTDMEKFCTARLNHMKQEFGLED